MAPFSKITGLIEHCRVFAANYFVFGASTQDVLKSTRNHCNGELH